ncbi:hypothetical protein [Escherichia coli]|uniref:hypothetical protein n=1 Tax=Escherichia coli TaxID=562 RepID=UPI000A6174F6|nr:hypothetical protein [Escherichia coli]
MTNWLTKPSKSIAAIPTAWIKQVPDLLFSYLRLTFYGVFLLLFLRSHYLPAG